MTEMQVMLIGFSLVFGLMSFIWIELKSLRTEMTEVRKEMNDLRKDVHAVDRRLAYIEGALRFGHISHLEQQEKDDAATM